MSFRNTYITEFLYKYNLLEELEEIKSILNELGTVNWQGNITGLGYFHGVIKDLDGHQTKDEEQEIVKKLEEKGVRIKIILE